MANCLIATGNELNCGEFTLQGGINKIYIANADQLTSFTDVSLDGIFDTITMVGANVFYELPFNNGIFHSQLTKEPFVYEQTIKITTNNIDLISQCSQSGLIVIFEFNNGKKLIYGYGLNGTKYPLRIQNGSYNSNNYLFSGYCGSTAPEFIGEILV